MADVSCLANVQSKLKSLTNTEKKVADFILNNYRDKEIYDKRFETYKKLYPQLKELYRSNY
ncbi:MAG: hypothetical protein Q4E91_14395 [Lachnospiraceae bacterium]|nr:hypothetical protein [Lachnospiraceae bacterium]